MAKNTLPPITNINDMMLVLQQWRTSLNGTLRRSTPPQVPWNFSATNARGGILLAWAVVQGADGYILLRADNSDFSQNVTQIPLNNGLQTQYFDAIAIKGVVLPTKYYKLVATSGTQTAPHSVVGVSTGIISSAPLDPADTASASTTSRDPVTDDDTQRLSGYGRYKQNYLLYGP